MNFYSSSLRAAVLVIVHFVAYLCHSMKKEWQLQACCCTAICNGCFHANRAREDEGGLKRKCPFCRKRPPKTKKEADICLMNRAAANDPLALRKIGLDKYLRGNDDDETFLEAVEYLSRAAALRDAFALFYLSCFRRMGKGVERDEKLGIYYLEESALAGANDARFALGMFEEEKGNFDRAVKHWIIAANCGHDDSLDSLKKCYKEGRISKEDFASALRTHQATVNATKSPQREATKDMFVIPFDTFDMICKQVMRMGVK